MSTPPARPAVITALLTAALLVAAIAADQNDPRLDGLFSDLDDTASRSEGIRITAEIWQLWLDAGDDEVQAHLDQGVAAMGAGDFDTALIEFDRVVELAPEFAEGWNKRATLYYVMEEYEASLADIGRTLTLEPRHFGAIAGRGLVNLQLGRPHAALQAFEEALEINPFLDDARMHVEALRAAGLGDQPI
jgi:tetratricopeptide (TPR) repeat protein